MRLPVKALGRGRMTSTNQALAPIGSTDDSLNFIHNRGTTTAKLRNALDRVWATRPANAAIFNLFEYVKSDLTKLFLVKQGSVLYSFADLTPTTTGTSIETGLDSTHIASIANANGFAFIADWQATNYVSNGTSAGTHELQKTAGASGAISGASAGTATGNAAGTVQYAYTNVDSVSGAESPPSTAISVTRTADQGVTITNVSLSFTSPWTTVNLYRTKAGGSTMYRVITGLTSGSFAYADTSLDTSLTTVSTVHGSGVVTASIEKPEAARFACFHRGRLFLANLAGNLPSRLRWSRPLEPTQFENTTTARMDIGKLDGGEITGLVSFRGALVIFKRNSVWICNGDVDEAGFQFAEVVVGKGCVAPWTIRKDGDRAIYFLSSCGVMSYDLSEARLLSDPIQDDIDGLEYTDRGDFFVAGIDPCERLYLLSVTPTGATTNTKTHALNLDTGAWGRFQWGMGKIVPSTYSDTSTIGPVRNSEGNVKLYLGDLNGYAYESDSATGADGVTSGDTTGTVTSATSTTTTCSAAAFRTTGDTLKGLPLTVRRAADNSYETVEITSNTATVITHGALSGTAIAVGDTIFIGAIQGTLAYNRIDLETGQRKRWSRMEVRFQKQSHSIPLRVGYTLNDDAAPTATTEYGMSNDFFARRRIDRRATSLAPYFDIIGTSCACELTGLDIEAEVLDARLPVR